MSRLSPFVLLCALAFVPDLAAATEVHLLDDAALSLELPGIPAENDSPLQLGLARPSAGPLQAIVGCAASYFFPGLGQILLGYPGRGLLLMAAEVVLALVGIGMVFAGTGFTRSFGGSAVAIGGLAALGLFGLVHFGGMLDAALLGMRQDRFGGG